MRRADDDVPGRVGLLNDAQLGRLARGVAVAVVESLAGQTGAGRSCFSLAEVARRASVSEDFVRAEVNRGRLRVVRPGAGNIARVLPEDERLWLFGRIEPEDAPAFGLSPTLVRRNRTKAIVGVAMRRMQAITVHKA